MEQTERKTGLATAFSPEGYIVDQARVTDVRYGCRPSCTNGCGWIAVYNLLRCLGDPAPYEKIVAALARHSLFRGLLGTSPLRVRRYLRRRGYPVASVIGKRKVAAAAAGARGGILVYRHSGGWHFVAFERRAAGRLRFYNAVAGACAYERTMEQFLTEQNLAKIVWLFSIPA